ALVRQDLLDRHRDRVRELVADALERGLTDQLGHAGLVGLLRHHVLRVEARPLGEEGGDHVGHHVHLLPRGRGDRDHLAVRAQELRDGDELLHHLLLGHGIDLGDDAHQRCGRAETADLVEDPPVAGPDPLPGREAHADEVDLRVRVLHERVEPLPQQRPWPLQPRRLHHDDLGVGSVDQAADRVAPALRTRRGDGDLLPRQRVGQRGFAGVGSTDNADEPTAEPLGCAHRISSSSFSVAPSRSDPARAATTVTTLILPRRSWPPSARRSIPEDVTCAPGRGTRPSSSASSPPTVSTSSPTSSGKSTSNSSASSSSPSRAESRYRPSRRSSTGATSVVSYSSTISPTISSRMSSIDTRPAIPPYSSTSTAR